MADFEIIRIMQMFLHVVIFCALEEDGLKITVNLRTGHKLIMIWNAQEPFENLSKLYMYLTTTTTTATTEFEHHI